MEEVDERRDVEIPVAEPNTARDPETLIADSTTGERGGCLVA
jgi:hypothetical protein